MSTIKRFVTTQDHFNRMAEITSVLIPKSEIHIVWHQQAELQGISFELERSGKSGELVTIGWLEFCTRELMPRLINENDRSEYFDILINNDKEDARHPVDYLWEEYSRLE